MCGAATVLYTEPHTVFRIAPCRDRSVFVYGNVHGNAYMETLNAFAVRLNTIYCLGKVHI